MHMLPGPPPAGGPGCSSEIAILYENGPYSVDKATMELVETKYGWDATHNMVRGWVAECLTCPVGARGGKGAQRPILLGPHARVSGHLLQPRMC